MTTEAFIYDLAVLVSRLDRKMLEFADPPPSEVGKGLTQALRAFGGQAVPLIHQVLAELWSREEGGREEHLVDVLADIGDPGSIPMVIELHAHHANYLTGLVAIQALRRFHREEAYLYMARLLTDYADGDEAVFESKEEARVSCLAMGDWGDLRAVGPLQKLLKVSTDPVHGVHEAAKTALARYHGLG